MSDFKHSENHPNVDNQLTKNYASSAKGKTGFKRIINATKFSSDGLLAAYMNEAAFRQVFWLNLGLFIALIFMPFEISIKMTLVFSSFLSLIVELLNTGLEASIDHTSTERHPLAKIGKDVGSAAQLLALTLLTLLWVMALWSTYA